MEAPRKGSKGGRVAIYDESLKIAVARDYQGGILSISQVAKKHRIGKVTAYHFVRWYKKFEVHPDSGAEREFQDQGQDINSLTKQLLASDQKLAYAEMRITALELLLKNAETEMGVDILKKSGTKR